MTLNELLKDNPELGDVDVTMMDEDGLYDYEPFSGIHKEHDDRLCIDVVVFYLQ